MAGLIPNQLEEEPPCTPRNANATVVVQWQETPPSTPRREQRSLDMAFPSPPPKVEEKVLDDDVMEAIDINSMPALSLALNRPFLKTGTMIHACIEIGHASALRFVLGQGVQHDLNKPSVWDRKCPLEFAFRPGSHEIINLLLDHGADPNMISSNGEGQRLLHKAAMSLNLSAVNLLLRYGADPRHVDDALCTPLHSVCKAVSDFAFSPASYRAIVDSLLAYGADPMSRDSAGFLAEHYAPPARPMPQFQWILSDKRRAVG